MLFLRPVLCFVVLAGTFIVNSFGATVEEELALESRSRGLGIAWFDDGVVRIKRLDSDRAVSEPVEGMKYLYDIDGTSGYILGSMAALSAARGDVVPTPPRLALFQLGGTAPILIGLSAPLLAVLSPHANRLAALIGTDANHIALKYGDTAWVAPREVYSRPVERTPYVQEDVAENFSWSPDAQKLVYSRAGSVYVFDTQKGVSTVLAHGADPTWSPDGSLIAYVSTGHQLVLIDPVLKTNAVVSGEMEVVGFPRWSPDSKFVLFSRVNRHKAVTDSFRYLFFHDATELVALRVADRQWAVVFDPGNGFDTRHFYWIQTGPVK